MRQRIRSRSREAIGGLRKTPGMPAEQGTYTISEGRIIDWTDKKLRNDKVDTVLNGTLPPTPLNFQTAEIFKPISITWRQYQSEFLQNWPGRHNFGYSNPPIIDDDWGPVDYGDVATALSRTNPFRYEVSIPVMLSEIVELSTLFKLVTRTMTSMLGSAHLSVNFGLAPFISDIEKLVNIVKAIRSRIREFNSLIEHGVVRRKVNISKASYSGLIPSDDPRSIHPVFTGQGIAVYATLLGKWSSKTWASTFWCVRNGRKLPVTQLDDFISAAAYFLDLDQAVYVDQNGLPKIGDPSTIWEAIPFSWLIDYFVNVGDSLRAVEEIDVVVPRDICIMRERTLELTVEPFVAPWWGDYALSASAGMEKHTLRERIVFGDDPSLSQLLSFGLMNVSQATNVAALLAVMTARSKRIK